MHVAEAVQKRVHDVVDVLAAERSRDANDGEHVAHACHGALERSRHGRSHAHGHGATATWTGSMDKRKAGVRLGSTDLYSPT